MAAPSLQPSTLPRLALLLGDMTGIGPELVARVVADGRLADVARIAVLGDRRVLEMGARDAGVTLSIKTVENTGAIDWNAPETPLIDLANTDPATLPRGEVSAASGKLTGDTLAEAVRLAVKGDFDAITFAPLNKAALHAGGWKFPDEHKMFAHLLDHKGYFSEMNVLDGQWMSRVTSHVSLRTALDQITHDSIIEAIELVDRTMRRAGIAAPRIAIAALNPHAGENGLFGREEIDLIGPAVKAAAAPRFSGMIADNDRRALATFAGETVRWSFWPSFAVGLGLLLCGEFLLSLFGPAFTAGYPLMAILFAGIMAKALVGPGEVLLTMAGKQTLCVFLYAGALTANILLNVTLIPIFGLTGAAAAAAGAMMVEAILLHLAVRRALGIVLFAFADPLALMNVKKAA